MEFPEIGQNCSEPTCNKLDFLPVKCDACGKVYCSEHMNYEKHGCESAYKKNIQVPVCPICNSPVPTPRNQKPDIAVSAHIDNDCKGTFNKKKNSNKCSVPGCKIKEMIPVVCSLCKKNFCLMHRFPDVHSCQKKGTQSIGARQMNQESLHIKAAQELLLSEDEALARALSESMKEAESCFNKNSGTSTTASINSSKCQVS